MKNQAKDWEKVVSMQISDKGLKLIICKELLNINKKDQQLNKNIGHNR